MNLVEGITPGRPLVCSDKGRHLCNNLLLHLSVLSESMCFFLSEYFCTQMILVFVWPEGHILHSLQCISLEKGSQINRPMKSAASLHSHQLGNQWMACFPNKALAALFLGAVPIKLVTQHQPRKKNDLWSSRHFLQLLSLSALLPPNSLHICLSVSVCLFPLLTF